MIALDLTDTAGRPMRLRLAVEKANNTAGEVQTVTDGSRLADDAPQFNGILHWETESWRITAD